MDLKRRKINICGVDVDDISSDNALKYVLKLAETGSRGKYVVTVNSEFVMLARRRSKFAQILKNADLALPDGAGVVISKLIFGGKEHDRVTGVDLVENICKNVNDKPIRIGFLGGFSSVADRVAQRQKSKHKDLKIVLAEPGEPTISYDLKLKKLFDKVGRIDILFVAYGMGQQEFWIERMHEKVNVGVMIGVGGAFDYLAGVKKRSPKLLQDMGLEWVWRLALDPARIWRFRVLPIFFMLVVGKFFWGKISNFFRIFFENFLQI